MIQNVRQIFNCAYLFRIFATSTRDRFSFASAFLILTMKKVINDIIFYSFEYMKASDHSNLSFTVLIIIRIDIFDRLIRLIALPTRLL